MQISMLQINQKGLKVKNMCLYIYSFVLFHCKYNNTDNL